MAFTPLILSVISICVRFSYESSVDDRIKRLELALKQVTEKLEAEQIARKQLETLIVQKECHQTVKRQHGSEAPEIAFFADVSDAILHQGQRQIVVFDHVVTNIDSANSAAGYSNVTGVFTAPIDGLYSFSTTVMTHADHASHYTINEDNTILARLWVDGSHDHQFASASANVVVSLTRGQAVSVRHEDIGDHGIEGSAQSLFSGFLLQQHYRSTEIVG